MTTKQESMRTGEFLISEGSGQISREAIILTAGAALPAGQVLGVVTASGDYAPYDADATNGTEVAVGVLYAAVAASATTRPGVAVVRLAEVANASLTGLDMAGQADLKSRYLIVR